MDKEEGFQIEETASARTLPYKNKYWNAITYELSLTRLEYTRTVYSFMDFLRDLGGLFSAIAPIFGFIVSVFQYRGPIMSLAAKMTNSAEP